jgi:aldehyde dehydrogenase (NAD+)
MTVDIPRDALPRVALHIGDQQLHTGSGGVFEHRNPATGAVQTTLPLAGPSEIDAAANAAEAAFELWRRWTPAARRDALSRLGELLEEHRREFTRIAALENGTPVRLGTHLVSMAKEWVLYYAGWADKLDGSVSGSFIHGTDFTYSQSEPYGVIGVIVTWNIPLLSLCMKVVPALAAGNTVVVKPSEFTPFTAELFVRLALEAGIPAGVINMVPGTAEAGHALVVHRAIEKISFTGGLATARKIMAACAEHLKPSVMELGGKSANIIFADADLKSAVFSAGFGGLSGQACVFGSRVLVQDEVYDEVLEKMVSAAEGLRYGDPADPSVTFGPVINEASCQRILGILKHAQTMQAGRLVTGGGRIGGEFAAGSFVQPTIFAEVDPNSALAQEEIFGPVIAVIPFTTEEQAIEIANNSTFGLSAYVHTRDVARVHRVANLLKAGSVYVNGAVSVPSHAPFGGQGDSGFGREGGKQGIDEFVRPKTVSIAQPR